MGQRPPIVAIDGPAGAGKSTVARELARILAFLHIDTGALYRAVALAAVRRGVSWDDASGIGQVAEDLVRRRALRLSTFPSSSLTAGLGCVVLEQEDVSDAIREPSIGQGASTVSAQQSVRAALLTLQRELGEAGGVVLEGRDIGTVVFPHADAKFFVTAAPEVRAQRRFDELRHRGLTTTFEATLADVMQRDAADTGRAVAPLMAATDAEIVDTSGMSIENVVAHLAARVRGRTTL